MFPAIGLPVEVPGLKDRGQEKWPLTTQDIKVDCLRSLVWVAVKELKLSYYIGETLLFTIDTRYGNSF